MNALDDSSRIRILLADDHPIYREGLAKILNGDDSFTIIAEVGDGSEALSGIRKLKPDVVLVDIDMPIKDGLVHCYYSSGPVHCIVPFGEASIPKEIVRQPAARCVCTDNLIKVVV